jgi:hypothetical protein
VYFTILQVLRLWIRFPMRPLDFSTNNLSSWTVALESTQPLTEMSSRNLAGGKGWPACKVDNSPLSVSRSSRKSGSLDISQPFGLPRPVTGIAFILYVCSPSNYNNFILFDKNITKIRSIILLYRYILISVYMNFALTWFRIVSLIQLF